MAADGSTVEGFDVPVRSNATYEPVVDQFELKEYEGLEYYLFTPEGAELGDNYPLVLFMADIGANGTDYRMALSQGIGGTIWATQEDQRKHPCYIVIPQFPFMQVMRDDFTYDPILLKVKGILDYVVDNYNVDQDRIYATGQSQGCMASCELNVMYPDYFAASLLVAGQWNPETMGARCAKKNFWIFVSEKDDRASSGMDAVVKSLEENGAKVGRYIWDAKASLLEQKKNIKNAIEDDVTVRYTVFAGDSVLPQGEGKHRHHAATWPVVYVLSDVRDWMFTCHRKGEDQ